MVTLVMIQFLVFAVEKFAASAANRVLMQKGVSTAFAMILKLGVVSSILPLQSFPMLVSNAPELQSELHRIFPEHFPPAVTANHNQVHSNPVISDGGSPGKSPSFASSPTRQSPMMHSPVRQSPVHQSPAQSSPIGAGSPATSPLNSQSPTHTDVIMGAGSSSSDTNSLGALSFLPDNQQTAEIVTEIASASEASPSLTVNLPEKFAVEIPESILAIGRDIWRNDQGYS